MVRSTWAVLAMVMAMSGGDRAAGECPDIVPGSCVESAAVVVAEPLVVAPVAPVVSYQVLTPSIVASPLVTSSVVVGRTHVAVAAVRPTIVRQRVVVRQFGVARRRWGW